MTVTGWLALAFCFGAIFALILIVSRGLDKIQFRLHQIEGWLNIIANRESRK